MACERQLDPASVSAVIVTYNNRAEIDSCLQSLDAHSPMVEIIVVDNLSTDGTLEHVRERYPKVRAVSSGRNGGFGAGVNFGAAMATGAFLAVLNPDTEVERGWLEPLVRVLCEHPGVGLVTPTILRQGTQERVNACGNIVHLTGLAFCAGLDLPAPTITTPAHSVAAISGAAFLVRKSVWEQLGGFDERFFMYLEDTDLSLRARRLGYDILHVPASRIWHSYTVRVSATKLYHLEYNRLLMLRKNLGPSTLLVLAPALVLTEVLIWAYCARMGPAYLGAKWRSYRYLWLGRRNMPNVRHDSGSDCAVLAAMSPCLAIDQLVNGRLVLIINGVLARYFTICRNITLSLVR